MSRQVAILVEGQTEEAFISRVLAPHLGQAAWLTPIIVHTKRTASGAHRGGGTWKGYREKLRKLAAESHWDMVTTMIDFYAYPADAPGARCHPPGGHTAADCATLREQAIRDQVAANLTPFVMVHEFETLVLAAASRQPDVWGDSRAPARFARMIQQAGCAEAVNDGPASAPSRRVAQVLQDYRKAQDGIDILGGHDFDDVLEMCPRFQAWVASLSDG